MVLSRTIEVLICKPSDGDRDALPHYKSSISNVKAPDTIFTFVEATPDSRFQIEYDFHPGTDFGAQNCISLQIEVNGKPLLRNSGLVNCHKDGLHNRIVKNMQTDGPPGEFHTAPLRFSDLSLVEDENLIVGRINVLVVRYDQRRYLPTANPQVFLEDPVHKPLFRVPEAHNGPLPSDLYQPSQSRSMSPNVQATEVYLGREEPIPQFVFICRTKEILTRMQIIRGPSIRERHDKIVAKHKGGKKRLSTSTDTATDEGALSVHVEALKLCDGK